VHTTSPATGNVETSVQTVDCKQVGDRDVKCAPITKTVSASCARDRPQPDDGLGLRPRKKAPAASPPDPHAHRHLGHGETSWALRVSRQPHRHPAGDNRQTIADKTNKYNRSRRAMQFKFNPNDSSFSAATPSAALEREAAGTTPRSRSSGSVQFNYTVSGGARKDQTEVEIVPPDKPVKYEQWLRRPVDDEKP